MAWKNNQQIYPWFGYLCVLVCVWCEGGCVWCKGVLVCVLGVYVCLGVCVSVCVCCVGVGGCVYWSVCGACACKSMQWCYINMPYMVGDEDTALLVVLVACHCVAETEGYQYLNLSSARIYMETCKMYNVVPASYFERHLRAGSDVMRMRHHGLGPQGARAIAVPLVSNMSITQLDLEDNWIEGEGAEYLAEMLKENFYISTLSLSNNQLGKRGAVAISDMMQVCGRMTAIPTMY